MSFFLLNFTAKAQKSAYMLARDLYYYADIDTTLGVDSMRKKQEEVLANLLWYARKPNIKFALDSLPGKSVLKRYAEMIYLHTTSREVIFSKSAEWRHTHLDTAKPAERELLRLLDSWQSHLDAQASQLLISSNADISAALIVDTFTYRHQLDSIREVSAKSKGCADDLGKEAQQLKKDVLKMLENKSLNEFCIKHLGKYIAAAGVDRQVSSQVQVIQKNVMAQEAVAQATSQTVSLPLSFRMPSQTEMIDALAIYLAKRVKQETVLWFFETIRKSAGRESLIRECFPETVKLLESGAIYETPNLGAAWRYALSKDFITFPDHALQSTWLRERIPPGKHNILADLGTGVTIARLIAQQYNFDDIIRHLYMDQPLTRPTEISQAITLLYAVRQELNVFKEGAMPEFRLSYENLVNMPDSSFVIMLELINLRYRNCIDGILGGNVFARSTLDYEAMRNWLGRIQITMQQVEKARAEFNEAVKLFENNPPKNFDFTHYSAWNFLRELIKNVVPDSTLSNISRKARLSFEYLADAQEIYALLEKKNYSGAISATFEVLDSIVAREEIAPELMSTLRFISDPTEFALATDKQLGALKLEQRWAATYKQSLDVIAPIVSHQLRTMLYGEKTPSPTADTTLYFCNARMTIQRDGKVNFVFNERRDTLVLADTLLFEIGAAQFESLAAFNEKITGAALKHNVWMDSIWRRALRTDLSDLVGQRTGLYQKDYYNARQTVTRLASFLSDVALAGDSKQLAQVVESYAMPPGSYKRKRHVWHSLDLSAFVGGYLGYEFPLRTFNSELPKSDANGLVYGLSAPVGITWSITGKTKVPPKEMRKAGHFKTKENALYKPSGNTLSLTFSLIDPAAVVSYRLTNTQHVAPQEFKWDQIISPGLHVGHSIRGTPLVVNLGAAFTPQLRRITNVLPETGTVDRQLNTIRLYAGIFFDLPLLNLWEKKDVSRNKWYDKNDFNLQQRIKL